MGAPFKITPPHLSQRCSRSALAFSFFPSVVFAMTRLSGESGALIYDDVPDLIYRCRAADKMLAASLDQHERDREQFAARLSASESECARLTAQLAAATARAGEAERDRDVACSNVDALMEKYQAARAALDSPRAAMEQCDAVISIGKERDDAMTALRELWLVCENGDLINENHPVRDVVVAALRAGGGR
jgi:hypothetical protein